MYYITKKNLAFALRTSTTATTTMHTSFTRMVTSTMRIGIPAGGGFPETDSDVHVWMSDETGYVNFNNIENGIFKVSYGIK